MKKNSILLVCLLFLSLSSSAKRIIGDLNFFQGDWVLIGVPMHNYHMLPIQEELSTFITQDMGFIRELQKDWDLDMTFEDKCDYHYALKFYQNGKLERTLLLNLHCGYISFNGLAYEFNPKEFEKFREMSSPVPWSRISFQDLGQLKEAVHTLSNTPNVYWYEDVKQYLYTGFVMLAVDKLPWYTDRDSLHRELTRMVNEQLGTDKFYLKKYFHIVQGDFLSVRYILNCESEHADRIRGNKYCFPYTNWRSHLYNRDAVSVVAIGINEKGYKRIMNSRVKEGF